MGLPSQSAELGAVRRALEGLEARLAQHRQEQQARQAVMADQLQALVLLLAPVDPVDPVDPRQLLLSRLRHVDPFHHKNTYSVLNCEPIASCWLGRKPSAHRLINIRHFA